MALQKTLTIPIGTNLNFKYTDFNYCTKNIEETAENCYIRIDNQSGNKEKIYLNIGVYDKKDGNLIITRDYEFTPNVDDTSSNFIKQGYEYLKTLDEYDDAIDVLDEGQTA